MPSVASDSAVSEEKELRLLSVAAAVASAKSILKGASSLGAGASGAAAAGAGAIDHLHGSAEYKEPLVSVFLERALRKVLDDGGAS